MDKYIIDVIDGASVDDPKELKVLVKASKKFWTELGCELVSDEKGPDDISIFESSMRVKDGKEEFVPVNPIFNRSGKKTILIFRSK